MGPNYLLLLCCYYGPVIPNSGQTYPAELEVMWMKKKVKFDPPTSGHGLRNLHNLNIFRRV